MSASSSRTLYGFKLNLILDVYIEIFTNTFIFGTLVPTFKDNFVKSLINGFHQV